MLSRSIALAALLLAAVRAYGQTSPAPAAAQAAPAGCDSPESHQFDFWVGRWSVSPTRAPDKHVADSLIEKLYSGCAVRENWMPLRRTGGGSLNAYVPDEHAWRQTWVDSSGSWVDYKGGWNGSAMVLTGATPSPGHSTQLTRMTFTKNSDGSVRQLGETTDDAGKTWQPAFDFTYHPAGS